MITVRLSMRLYVLALLACLVGTQLHVSAELGPALWNPDQSPRAPGHGPYGHGCQACFSAGWATVPVLPRLVFALSSSRLEVEKPQLLSRYHLAKVSSPRAPPSV